MSPFSLAQLQNEFQQAILREAATPDLLAQLRSPRAEANEAFAVYHDGYRLRLAEFLANDFPTLRAAMGDSAFGALVEAFIGAQPSRHRNARWYGAGLPDFLRSRENRAAPRFCTGMADFEAALGHAFDAEDKPSLPIAALAAFAEADWPRLKFAFHPSFRLVEAPAATTDYYEAFQSGETLPPVETDADEDEVAILVWRHLEEISYRQVDPLEAMALREARDGRNFGEICGLLAFACPQMAASDVTQAAAGFLVRWFSDELIVQSAP